MEDVIVVALFGAMGGLYALAATGFFVIVTRLGKVESHMAHSVTCQQRVRLALRVLIRRTRELTRGQAVNDELIRAHIVGGK